MSIGRAGCARGTLPKRKPTERFAVRISLVCLAQDNWLGLVHVSGMLAESIKSPGELKWLGEVEGEFGGLA